MLYSIRFTIFLIGLFTSNAILANETSITLKKPPGSLKAWYKPVNKRQVWLHTMFRLRRELLAINDYSQAKQGPLLDKWFKAFKKDYLEVEKMMPEWQEFLDKPQLDKLQLAVENRDFPAIPNVLKNLKQSCDNCHSDYQAMARLMYRSADFAKIKVHNTKSDRKISYDRAMEELSNVVNRIKIAMHDDSYERAIKHLATLQSGLMDLANGCQDCHKQADEQIDYIIHSSQPILSQLQQALETKNNKQARISLGTFAVKTCARCHSVHRTTAELKELVE